jgi:AraC-like DNA-binding protein
MTGVQQKAMLPRKRSSQLSAGGGEPAPEALISSGSLPQLETMMGSPAWFRYGTGLGPAGTPFPDRIMIVDDLRIVANILDHGATAQFLSVIISAPRAPMSRGWGAAMAVAPTLGDALALMMEQVKHASPYLNIRLERREGTVMLTADVATFVPEALRPLIATSALFLLWWHLRPYGVNEMRACSLESAALASPDLTALQRDVATRLRFGANRCRLSFPESWLERSNPDADAALWQLQASRLERGSKALTPLAEAVSDAVRICLEQGRKPPPLAAMALTLGLSERTFVRRLTAAGTSYSRLIDGERCKLATRLIADPAISLQQVADRLAFGDRQGFGRAFRAWFGESPGRYRRKLLSERTKLA